MWKQFNPTVNDLLKDNPDKTILGLWWSWYWRIIVLILGSYMALMIVAFTIGILSAFTS